MWPNSSWIRRITAVGLWWLMLAFATVKAEVRIEAEPADPNAGLLVRLVREALSERSPDVADLDARITIGATAFRNALAEDDGRPLIAAYITSTEFDAVLGARARPTHITAVFSNPDPQDQVALAQALLGGSALGAFDSPASRSLVARIATRGVKSVPVSPNQTVDSLLRAANPFDAIVVLPDATLNRANINHVVRTLYARRKVLIGYSATLTRVGALASVYVPPEAIADTVASAVKRFSDSGTMPEPTFVRDIDVALNVRLARSLNIALPARGDVVQAVRSRRE